MFHMNHLYFNHCCEFFSQQLLTWIRMVNLVYQLRKFIPNTSSFLKSDSYPKRKDWNGRISSNCENTFFILLTFSHVPEASVAETTEKPPLNYQPNNPNQNKLSGWDLVWASPGSWFTDYPVATNVTSRAGISVVTCWIFMKLIHLIPHDKDRNNGEWR